jgi:hypothetical protein
MMVSGESVETKKTSVDKKARKNDDTECCQIVVPFSKLFAGIYLQSFMKDVIHVHQNVPASLDI